MEPSALPLVEFHADKVPYTISHIYNPDFTISHPDRTIYIEAKGYFQDAQEIQKYPAIRDCLAANEELVFVFEKPEKPIHFRTKRKDGTRMSHGEWATKNKFRHFTLTTVGELFDQ